MIQAFYEFVRVAAFEDVERLLFEKNLLVWRQVAGQRVRGFVRDGDDVLSKCFGNICGAGGSFDAVWREGRELRIILGVIAAMRDQKNAALAGSIGQPADIGGNRSAPGT